MAWYRAGTVSCAQNSTTVTGTNTLFTVYCRVGDGFIGPDGVNNEVVNIVSDTQLTLAQPYKGPSANNQAYAIIPVQGYNKAAADALRAVLRQMDSVTESEQQAGASRDAAAQSATAAGQSATAAQQSASSASTSKDAAAQAASAASGSATAAGQSATDASSSKDAAAQSATAAGQSATAADASAKAAAQSATQTADKLPLAGGRMTGAIEFAPILNVASAATTPIAGANSNSVNVTGTTTITAFDTPTGNAIGVTRRVTFQGALTLTHSASLIMPGGVNQVTMSGDVAEFEHIGNGAWRCVRYQRIDSPPFRSTQSTTDATVGRQVKVGDFGIGAHGVNLTDANAAPAVNGRFKLPPAAGNNGPDTTSFWTIDQYIYDAERTQFAIREGGTDLAMFYRKYNGATSTWFKWTPNVLAGSPLLGGFKNKLLNANFGYSQRGNPRNVAANTAAYTLDQWLLTVSPGGAENIQIVFGQTALRNSQSCARWTKTAAGAGSMLRQWMEEVSTLHGRTVTLSFWAKFATTGFSTPFYCDLTQIFGSGGSANTGTYLGAFTPDTAWRKYTFTAALPDIAGKVMGTTPNFLQLAIVPNNNAAFTLDIAEIQLEEGPVASEFERRPYGVELAALSRYLQIVAVSGRFTAAAAGQYYNAAINWTNMRAVPTLSVRDTGSMANISTQTMNPTGGAGGRLELVSAAAGDTYFLNYNYLASAEI